MIDATKEAARILARKLHITNAEADVLIFVDLQKGCKGEKRLGPFSDVLVKDGWVIRAFIMSSGKPNSAINSLLDKRLLIPMPITRDDGQVGTDQNWVKTSDAASKQIAVAYNEVEKLSRR